MMGSRNLAAAVVALVVAGCPRPKAATTPADEPLPPPFRAGVEGELELGEPPGPAADKFGLAYMELLYPGIREGWATFLRDCQLRLPASDGLNNATLVAVVAISVAADGKLVAVEITSSSGNAQYDGAAVEIVRDSGPFPPPPVEVVSDDDLVHLSWSFARDQRQAGLASAAIEQVMWPVGMAVPKLLAGNNVTAAALRLAAAANSPGDGGGAETDLVGLGVRIAHQAIVEALASDEVAVQRLAIAAAAAAAVTEAGPRIVTILTSSGDQRVVDSAIAALGELGHKAAIATLLTMLDDRARPAETRLSAANALVALGAGEQVSSHIATHIAGDEESRLEVLPIVARVSVPAIVPELSAMMSAAATPRGVRSALCAALGSAATPAAIKVVKGGLRNRDAAVRAACARALVAAADNGATVGRTVYWELVGLLKARDERVRAAAVVAAARLDPKRVGKELYLLRKERSVMVKAALAEALAGVPGTVAYRRLVDLAADSDVVVRRRAVAALLKRPEQQARAVVAAMSADVDLEIKLMAIRASDGSEALLQHLTSPVVDIQAAALAGLVRARGQRATIAEVFARLAATPAGGGRAQIALSWLKSK